MVWFLSWDEVLSSWSFLCQVRKQSCPTETDSFHGGNTHKCVCEGMEEKVHFLGIEDLFQWEKTPFRGPEGQRWLIRGDNPLVRWQSANLQEIFKRSETPRSHVVTANQAQAQQLCWSFHLPEMTRALSQLLEVSWKIPHLMTRPWTAAASTRALPGTAPVSVVWLDRLKVLLQWMLHHGSLSITREVSAVLFTILRSPLFKSFLTKGSLNACIDSWLRSAKYPHVAKTWRFFKAA